MSANQHIVDAEQLRQLSGKSQHNAVRRWASAHGIPTMDGGDGPWTTTEAINKALGVSSNDAVYRPEDIV